MEHDWDLQHVLRLIVTSQTYQQSSVVTPALLERDPDNRLLARGARFRLPSWMIRDAALQASGLLNPAVGGPPVSPYQPDVWAEMFMGRFRYEPDLGPAQFRRSLYAFWRRSAAPTFLFDSAQRRVCEVRPQRTNTPLQALTMLNDLTQREAAREVARVALTGDGSPQERLQRVFRAVLSRDADPRELNVLSRELQRARAHYDQHPDEARAYLTFGQPDRSQATSSELAAYTLVASLVFNLDEAMTHE